MGIQDELKKYLIEDLNLEDLKPDNIENDSPLFGDGLGLDSLDAVELVVILQKRFGVTVKDMEEAKEAFISINTLADYIRKKTGG